MPLRLDVKRTLSARSDRAKSVDLHPTEPWMLVCLYNGNCHVWNTATQLLIKSFEVTDLPVRCGQFVARKNWIITGSDDMMIRVFNYNTLEKVNGFEAHSDYLRCLQVHPTQPFLLSSSDDMTIKLWDWDKKWQCIQTFEGHTHYVMQIVVNPKDNNQFASASLDRTIKVWQLGSTHPNFTLEGHEKGVNCVDYFHGGEKPYLVSGADDRTVKIWDYQNKTCVQTLEGHAQNVSCVLFHPELPIVLSGSEDGTVRIWHTNTHRLESTLNYGMERVWAMSAMKGTNDVAIGYDEGSIMVKLGREEPAMSMDSSGKIIFAKHSEILQANLKNLSSDAEIKDGEVLPVAVKEMGSCEIYPQALSHNPNGRFVVVCGDGEYIIYTAMALRNKSFGSASEFVWASDSSEYAIRESTKVKIFKNFKEKKAFKPEFNAEGIYGGSLLGVRSALGLCFYDWETQDMIRRIDIQPKSVIWSENGEMCCITTEESFFVLKYSQEAVSAAMENKDEMVTEDGIEEAFDVLGEFEEVVKTGIWVGDCFIYTNSVNRLNYYVGGEIVTVSHLDKSMYLLGYIPKDNRLYLADKELNVVSYHLLLSVLEYQTAVMRKDFETAKVVLPTIPKEQRNRVAHFLEKQGFKQQALHVSCDPEHKFELALQIGELATAYEIALDADSEQKWKHLAELAIQKCEFALAQECLHKAQDYAGLLLLASCSGDALMMEKLATDAEKNGKFNVSFLAYFSLGKLEECLELLCKSNRLPEAAFLARTYLPSQVPRIIGLWKEDLAKTNKKAADALADPTQYSNLFPDIQEAITAEDFLKLDRLNLVPAALYPSLPNNHTRDALGEVRQAREAGSLEEILARTQALALGEEASPPAVEESAPEPEPAVPVEPEPAAPIEPEPAGPIEPEPAAPIEPEPAAPIEPEPAAPIEPEPIVDIEMETAVATEPEPAVAIEPEPAVAIEPEPAVAIEPEPAVAIEPEPAAPVESEPAAPVEPEPAVSLEPEPAVLIDAEPIVSDPEPLVLTESEPVTLLEAEPEPSPVVEATPPRVSSPTTTLDDLGYVSVTGKGEDLLGLDPPVAAPVTAPASSLFESTAPASAEVDLLGLTDDTPAFTETSTDSLVSIDPLVAAPAAPEVEPAVIADPTPVAPVSEIERKDSIDLEIDSDLDDADFDADDMDDLDLDDLDDL